MTDALSSQDLETAQNLLAELFADVSSEESVLSGGTRLGLGGNTIQSLQETKITFGNPSDELIRLTPDLFDRLQIPLKEIYKRQMREQFNFYHLSLNINLFARGGMQFSRLQCTLSFGPKGSREPIIQSLFPTAEWKEVLGWGGGMKLALNGNLEWGAEVAVPDEWLRSLPSTIRANIDNKNQLNAFVAVPDYSFKMGRVEIAATGEGNSECAWEISKPDLSQAQNVKLAVVFKVPKEVSDFELTGLSAAEVNMPWLVANVGDVFEGLSRKLQDLLRRRDSERLPAERFPIGDHETWNLRLPG
jgi:hypothetical protein